MFVVIVTIVPFGEVAFCAAYDYWIDAREMFGRQLVNVQAFHKDANITLVETNGAYVSPIYTDVVRSGIHM